MQARSRIRYVRMTFPRTGVQIDAELARTPEERRRGLAGRAMASPMIFIFDEDGRWPMTMQPMRVPLDMLFMSHSGSVVDLFRNLPAGRLETIVPRAPSRYCLELPNGWIDAMGIAIGDRAFSMPLVR